MQTFIVKITKAVNKRILGPTLYEMMRSSPDFEDVKLALNDRTDWSIEVVSAYSSVVYAHLTIARTIL